MGAASGAIVAGLGDEPQQRGGIIQVLHDDQLPGHAPVGTGRIVRHQDLLGWDPEEGGDVAGHRTPRRCLRDRQATPARTLALASPSRTPTSVRRPEPCTCNPDTARSRWRLHSADMPVYVSYPLIAVGARPVRLRRLGPQPRRHHPGTGPCDWATTRRAGSPRPARRPASRPSRRHPNPPTPPNGAPAGATRDQRPGRARRRPHGTPHPTTVSKVAVRVGGLSFSWSP